MEPAVPRSRSAVAGRCPMGCGDTLFVASGGFITCSNGTCPDSTIVTDILEDRETEHMVTLGEAGFTIRHPLRERKDRQLEDCSLHRYIEALDGPPRVPGLYRVRRGERVTGTPPLVNVRVGSWEWETVTTL
ncbi:DUF6085 family protein [Rhodococcus sp. 14-2470-1a]|uniref:DUF6085 family protein n=1 Tax=Rhodococcus sp. 14-2470-1a TaxID=2023150 RepID=UPI0015C5C3FC|nr:DUF6085 family protein [Rhodococcus sp. 14-2470-1a]